MGETERELELEIENEDVTVFLKPQDKIWMGDVLLLTDEQRKWFIEMKSTGEYC